MVYECESCGYQTNKNSNYIRHKNRKHSCAKTINDNKNENTTKNNVGQNLKENGQNLIKNGQNLIKNGQNLIKSDNQYLKSRFICNKCNKMLSCKKTLSYHLSICKGVKSKVCPYCKEEFTTDQAKYYHIKRNKCKENGTTIINNNINNTTNNTTNNTNCHNTTNNNNVQIVNVFGNEDLTYLSTDKSILQRLKAFGKSGIYGLSKIIGDVHFNKERPENNTIIKPEEYGNGVMILNEDKEWEFREFEDVRETLITTITKYLRAYTTVKNNLGVKLVEEKERNIIKNIAYEFMAIEGVVPEELFEELEMDGDNVEDDVMDHKIRKFDKSTMKNIHNRTVSEFKKEKGNYIKV